MILSKLVNNKNQNYINSAENLKLFLNFSKSYPSLLHESFDLCRRNGYFVNSKRVNNKINQHLVSYVINVVLSPTNTIVSVCDVKGKALISVSAGLSGLKKFQKKSQPSALVNVFKVLFVKAKFLRNKPVVINFKNVKRFHESLLLSILKDKIFIKSFQSYNLTPHNGCRPKKIKRIKRRTKRLVLR